MQRTCTICTHAERAAIERQLLSCRSYREITRTHAVGRHALRRHHDNHLAPSLLAHVRLALSYASREGSDHG